MTTDAENRLEELLRSAATEPADRPEFFQELLDADVYILGFTDQESEGEQPLQEGSSVSIQHWERPDGSPVIPFFSSLAVLRESIDTEQSYIELPARALFEMTSGASLVLNPQSEFGKEFSPQEIAWLLDDGIGAHSSRRIVEHPTQVILAQPEVYPDRMVESLTKLFVKHKNVNRAFIGLMLDPAVDEHPHLIIGIEAEGDVDQVFDEAGSVAVDSAADGEAVDLVRITEGDEGISQYFLTNTKPFYDRSWVGRMSEKGSA